MEYAHLNTFVLDMSAKQTLSQLKLKKQHSKTREAISAVWEARKSLVWEGAAKVSARNVEEALACVRWEDKFTVDGEGTQVKQPTPIIIKLYAFIVIHFSKLTLNLSSNISLCCSRKRR